MNGRVTKRGRVYQGEIYFGSQVVDGRRVKLRQTFTCRTRGEATRELHRRLVDANGVQNETDLATALRVWLDRRRGQIAEQTWDGYDSIIRNHLIPAFGKVSLGALDNRMIEFYETQALEHLSTTSVRQHHAVLRKFLSDCERQGLILRNPARLVTPPRAAHRQLVVLSLAEMRALVHHADDWLRCPIVLAVTTGMRIGEICALRWSDVDDGVLSVRRSVQELTQGLIDKAPKTRSGVRAIPVPALTRTVLAEQRQRQEKLATALSERPPEHVCTGKYGRPLRPTTLDGAFALLQEREGLRRVRFHDLRHSHATLLAAMGENPKVVQERLGHSTVQVTLDLYTHVLPQMQAQVVEKLNSVWGNPLDAGDG